MSTHENSYVIDTMGLILRVETRRLSPSAKAIRDAVEAGAATVYVPAMTFAEILYLSEKGRITCNLTGVSNHLERYPGYIEYPLNREVISSAATITDIPELHDRLIAGTASHLGLPLIANDPIIQASSHVSTVW